MLTNGPESPIAVRRPAASAGAQVADIGRADLRRHNQTAQRWDQPTRRRTQSFRGAVGSRRAADNREADNREGGSRAAGRWGVVREGYNRAPAAPRAAGPDGRTPAAAPRAAGREGRTRAARRRAAAAPEVGRRAPGEGRPVRTRRNHSMRMEIQ